MGLKDVNFWDRLRKLQFIETQQRQESQLTEGNELAV